MTMTSDRRVGPGRGSWAWLVAPLFFFASGCGGAERVEPRDDLEPPASESAERTPADEAAQPASTAGAADTPECAVSCCSPATLERQREAAARIGDPSIAGECCFCDE
jgi:hypothetical protein